MHTESLFDESYGHYDIKETHYFEDAAINSCFLNFRRCPTLERWSFAVFPYRGDALLFERSFKASPN